MRSVLVFAGAFLAAIGSAQAAWMTKVEDDILSGGSTAFMLGYVNPNESVAVDCDSDSLVLSFVMKTGDEPFAENDGFRVVVKVDGGAIHEMSGRSRPRNTEYGEVYVDSRADIVPVLKEIGAARSKIVYGIEHDGLGIKWTGQATAGGSTKAVKRLMAACGLE